MIFFAFMIKEKEFLKGREEKGRGTEIKRSQGERKERKRRGTGKERAENNLGGGIFFNYKV